MKKWEKSKTETRKNFSMFCNWQCNIKNNGIASI